MIIKVKNAEAFKTSSRNAGRVCRPFVVFAVLCAVLLLSAGCLRDIEPIPEPVQTELRTPVIPAPTDPASQGEPTEVSSESAPTATPDPLAAIEGRNIVYGPALPDEDIVYNGEVMIYNPLRDDTLDPAYADSLFYVTIEFRNLAVDTVRKTFGAIEAEYREITSSTIWETDELHNGFSYWWYYIKEPSLSERERELYERRMSKDFGGFDHNVPYYTEYCDYVEERISFNRAEKLREYIRKLARASTDYFCYETPAEAVEEHIAEINRLIECGYAVDINTLVIPWPGYNGRVNAYLSGDQLQSFEAYPEYAYKIYYARHE